MYTRQFFISINGTMNLIGITRSSLPQITRVRDFISLILILLAVVLYLRAEVKAFFPPDIEILSCAMKTSVLLTRAVVVADSAFFNSVVETASIMPTNLWRPGEVEKDLGVKDRK